jgi:glycosyltransferase EpsE
MGIYNCAETLSTSIYSLINQTYRDFEIILYDDGSTDETYNTAKILADKDDRIILIRNERNKGLSHALNHCLLYAKGEYIARQDGDDISLPHRFEKQIEAFENHPGISIVSTAMIYFNETGEYAVNRLIEYPASKHLLYKSPICHASCMVQKKAFQDVSGYSEKQKCYRVEDYDLWFRMYAKGHKAYNILEPLYMILNNKNTYKRRKFKYRINESRVMFSGIKMLGFPAYYCIFALKPLVAAIFPKYLLYRFHRLKWSKL